MTRDTLFIWMKSKSYTLERPQERQYGHFLYGGTGTYRGSELIADKKAIFDLDCADHVLRHAHHHLLLLELLGVKHGLLLSL